MHVQSIYNTMEIIRNDINNKNWEKNITLNLNRKKTIIIPVAKGN